MDSFTDAARLDPYVDQRRAMNECRYLHHAAGHYESYFLRANHPSRPLAFWLRYTIFAPKGHAEHNLGELWAILFDGESKRIVVAKESCPLAQCQFDNGQLNVLLKQSRLRPGVAIGEAKQGRNRIEWDLSYQPGDEPVYLLPESLYDTPLPKAKALVANPNAVFRGTLRVNGETIVVDHWVGSENHNWGSQHTDEYAWGQVAGFDNDSDAFLECATVRVRLGPIKSPRITMLVCRVAGETYVMNNLLRAALAKGRYEYFNWEFEARNQQARIRGVISAPKHYFVGLTYHNPPGGSHTCLNSKLAQCRLTITPKDKAEIKLHTEHRAAFEILTDDHHHGVPIVA
ncbi:MAG: hypothetical protein VYA55_04955 [Pseudomonadota bacterium]|nr:hypothetical protein [Pseudomonadota bacterium]